MEGGIGFLAVWGMLRGTGETVDKTMGPNKQANRKRRQEPCLKIMNRTLPVN